MSLDKGYLGLAIVAVATAAIIVVGGVIIVERSSSQAAMDAPIAATPEYGRRLLRETSALMGPGSDDPNMQFSGTNIACASCHLDVGQRPGTLTLLQAAAKYPLDSGRDGRVADLRDRINGCMQRSMNGRPLARDSVEMIAMEAYIEGLGHQYAAMSVSQRTPDEPPAFKEPDRAASIEAGRIVYESRCYVCHGDDGSGLQATPNLRDGYVFPPLWGPDSFNNGAGMTRVLTAAKFIKARMPFGQPDLTDDQSYDVAAFVNSHERPVKPNLEVDFPDKTRKPVDSPYPPYADSFPQEQHKLGPFKPIREYYQKLKEESPAVDDAR
jgi:thiosulfate dehydrogenase